MPSTWHGDENVIKLEPLVSATLVMPTMSTTLPQETQGRERMPHSNAPAWPGNENVIKMEPLVSAASVMPATVTTSTASPQETQSSARMPCSDAPAWPGDENVIKLEPLMSAASVMPTSNQSGGSMMSLLLGAWSQHTLDAVKTEESSAQWDSSNTTDMPANDAHNLDASRVLSTKAYARLTEDQELVRILDVLKRSGQLEDASNTAEASGARNPTVPSRLNRMDNAAPIGTSERNFY
ncbi:hypothetical protein PC112_g14058 [Phytophthora cactorum]|nr:hypothetical protein PC112_g14058 [Phytophthora cactorum]